MSTTMTYKEKLQLLLNTKTQFKNDIINAGGTIDNSTPFSSYPAIYKTLKGGAPDGTAVEINTPEGMAAAITESNIGKFYKYTGPSTAEYNTGDLYIVQDLDNPLVDECSGGNSVTITANTTKIAIPAGSYIDHLVIDTSKSESYVDNVLSKLTYAPIKLDSGGDFSFNNMPCYVAIYSASTNTALYIFKSDKGYLILGILYGTAAPLYDTAGTYYEQLLQDSGWLDKAFEEAGEQVGGIISVPVGANNESTFYDYDGIAYPVGTQNELLKDVLCTSVGSTPTINLSGEYKSDTLFITKKGSVDLLEEIESKHIPTQLYIAPETLIQNLEIDKIDSWYDKDYTPDYGYEAFGKVTVKAPVKNTVTVTPKAGFSERVITCKTPSDMYHTIICKDFYIESFVIPKGITNISYMFGRIPVKYMTANYASTIASNAFYPNGSSTNKGCIYSFSSTSVYEIDSLAFLQSALHIIDLGESCNIKYGAFSESALTTAIFRNDLMSVFEEDVFKDTPIERGEGYIYVPDTLVDSYKGQANLSTVVNQIRPLSEYVEAE